MSNLVRWNPFRDMVAMNEAIDRLFDDTYLGRSGGFQGANPTVDLLEKDDHYIVKAELPGFDPSKVDIRVEGNLLTLKGEYNQEGEKQEGEYHLRERRQGNFTRTFSLPTPVNADKATAEFENGVLTLNLPKDETAMPKRINIKGVKNIEAKTGQK